MPLGSETKVEVVYRRGDCVATLSRVFFFFVISSFLELNSSRATLLEVVICFENTHSILKCSGLRNTVQDVKSIFANLPQTKERETARIRVCQLLFRSRICLCIQFDLPKMYDLKYKLSIIHERQFGVHCTIFQARRKNLCLCMQHRLQTCKCQATSFVDKETLGHTVRRHQRLYMETPGYIVCRHGHARLHRLQTWKRQATAFVDMDTLGYIVCRHEKIRNHRLQTWKCQASSFVDMDTLGYIVCRHGNAICMQHLHGNAIGYIVCRHLNARLHRSETWKTPPTTGQVSQTIYILYWQRHFTDVRSPVSGEAN